MERQYCLTTNISLTRGPFPIIRGGSVFIYGVYVVYYSSFITIRGNLVRVHGALIFLAGKFIVIRRRIFYIRGISMISYGSFIIIRGSLSFYMVLTLLLKVVLALCVVALCLCKMSLYEVIILYDHFMRCAVILRGDNFIRSNYVMVKFGCR